MGEHTSQFDFEKPILEIERRIEDLEKFQQKAGVDLSEQIAKLREDKTVRMKEIFSNLTAWQRVMLAREPNRPDAMDYIATIFDDFLELHGDRAYGDDKALVAGFARIGGRRVMLIAQRKGKNTKERVAANFGSPHPEGYRKALEKMKLAEKFHLPVITLVNTPGAYPGIGAEERGQAHSIAYNMREMARLKTPIYICVIGEGGSGGALGIGVGDWMAMLENAYYSVISPEGCAAILWRDRARAPDAAAALKLASSDLSQLGIVDEAIEEPLGGAHRDPELIAQRLRASILRFLKFVESMPVETLLTRRYDRFRKIGVFSAQQHALLSPTT